MALSDSFAQGQTIFVHGDCPITANYSDATFAYLCIARQGTALTEAKWRVVRTTLATGDIRLAPNASNWGDVATNISVVGALGFT